MPDTTSRLFTPPGWFGDLLAARLGLGGDTFWIGNFGTGLVLVPPAHVVIVILLQIIGLGGDLALARVTGVFMVLLTLYFIALLRAVFLCARRTPEVGGWRWIGGVIYTAMNVLVCALVSGGLYLGGLMTA